MLIANFAQSMCKMRERVAVVAVASLTLVVLTLIEWQAILDSDTGGTIDHCQQLFDNDTTAVRRWSTVTAPPRADRLYVNFTCDDYRLMFTDTTGASTVGETRLAFVVLAYKDVAHVVNLIRMLYSPMDTYCIHVDAKSKRIYEPLRRFATCLPNVMLTRRQPVYWASHGILQANLNCIGDLLAERSWQYVISVSAQDVPLMSVDRMRQVIGTWNGRNDVEVINDVAHRHRYEYHHEVIVNQFGNMDGNRRTAQRKSPPPSNLTIYKNNVATTLTRQLAEFGVTSDVGMKLNEWLNDTDMPDEHFWATLVANEHVWPANAADKRNAFMSRVR